MGTEGTWGLEWGGWTSYLWCQKQLSVTFSSSSRDK